MTRIPVRVIVLVMVILILGLFTRYNIVFANCQTRKLCPMSVICKKWQRGYQLVNCYNPANFVSLIDNTVKHTTLKVHVRTLLKVVTVFGDW